MAEVLKRLGATLVVATTDTLLYQVPAGKNASVSSVVAVNRGDSVRTFRIAHVDGAIATVANEDYIAYDFQIPPRTAIPFTLGICMGPTDSIMVRADHADVSFIAWGAENQ